jgi:hypothetical protein
VSGCVDSIPLSRLVAYLTRELDAGDETAFEDHFFACPDCTARLTMLADLGDGIAALAGSGSIFASVTRSVLDRATAGGLRIRSYRLEPDERVACTIAPDDDANVIRLVADFAGVDRVDLDVFSVEGGRETRTQHLEELAVDRASNELVLVYPGDAIRALPHSTHRLELFGRREGDRRSLGSYTLNHSPWPGGSG